MFMYLCSDSVTMKIVKYRPRIMFQLWFIFIIHFVINLKETISFFIYFLSIRKNLFIQNRSAEVFKILMFLLLNSNFFHFNILLISTIRLIGWQRSNKFDWTENVNLPPSPIIIDINSKFVSPNIRRFSAKINVKLRYSSFTIFGGNYLV